MKEEKTSIKRACTPEMTEIIRRILYSRHLSYGAKCLGIAILDSPRNKKPRNSILARRLGCRPSQVTKWIRLLKKVK